MGDFFRPAATGASGWYREDRFLLAGGLAVIAVILGVGALVLNRISLDLWVALILALVLIVASVPLFRWVGRVEDDPWLVTVLMWALPCAFLFALLRYLFVFVLYDGGDAAVYHEAGRTFVEHLRAGGPLHPIPAIEAYPVQTQRVGDLTGVLYVLTRPSIYAGFVAFTYLAFIGKVFLVRAFRVAVPEGDQRRFTLLVMFLPSVLFWPASIGKEAVMMACLGLITYGGALLLAPVPRLRGVLLFGAGASLVLLVRPHVAIMSILAFGVAIVAGVLGRSSDARSSGRARAFRLAALVVVVVLGAVGSTRLAAQFDEFAEDGTEAALTGAMEQSATGASEFSPVAVNSVLEVPAGMVSVLFRPFPFEAGSIGVLISSAEGVLLFALIAVSWRRVASFPKLARRRPFLVFMAGYIVLFTIAFSFIANFGILSRQRVLVLPAILMLLALPRRGGAADPVVQTDDAAAVAAPADAAHGATTLTGSVRSGETSP